MKKQIPRFTLYLVISYLTITTFNIAVAASQPSWGNRTYFCGVIDDRWNKQQLSDQLPNRDDARTAVANLNVGEPFTVRVIHFIPNDREPNPNMGTKLDKLIKDIQRFYADQMEAHGFGRKTFRFEADDAGNVVVHRVNGKYNDADYQQPSPPGSWIVWREIEAQFDMSRNIYLLALDSRNDFLDGDARFIGWGTGSSLSGKALIPASNFDGAAHELGHGFGLEHGDPAGTQIRTSPTIGDPMISSFCAAEWLDGHRYFNSSQNAEACDNTDIKILAPSLAAPPCSIRLRFEVCDPDGLHQAQLIAPLYDDSVVIGCKRLSGDRRTVDFVTTKLIGAQSVYLVVIDGHGNFTYCGPEFPIDVTPLLPPPEAISIPDPNLAAAVRDTLGMASSDPITQLNMFSLGNFVAVSRGVTDLTGIEGGINLTELHLGDNLISDITAVSGLTNLRVLHLAHNSISDISPVAGLTDLTNLNLDGNSVSDISAVLGLTNLRELRLGVNAISDISAVSGLTNLTRLNFGTNTISDISAVADLTQLTELYLDNNLISNISAVTELTNLRTLYLDNNAISDVSPLLGLNLTGTSWDSTGLYLKDNPLSYASINTYIPILKSKGVQVDFDNQAHPALLKISGDNQKGAAFVSLSQPFVVEAQDAKGSALTGISVVFAVTGGGGTLSTQITSTDANGRAQSTLILGP